jgi:hypothetical protein
MIRRLLFATIWGYVFSLAAFPLSRLAVHLWGPGSVALESDPEMAEAMAKMLVGIPGLAGIVGVAWAFIGFLPGTSWRRAAFQPSSTQSVFRDLKAASFALRQFLDGYPYAVKATTAQAQHSDLPRIGLLTTGILAVVLGVAGTLCSALGMIRLEIPARVVDVTLFRIAAYAISVILMGVCAGLVFYGLEFVKGHPHKVRPFACLVLSEMLCIAMLGFACRALSWLAPDVGTVLGAAIPAANSGFEVQVVVLFPLWAPFVALWAMYQLQAQAAAGDASAVVRVAKPGVNKSELIKTLQARYLVVRQMFQGFEYTLMLGTSPAQRKVGVAAAAHFIRTRSEGENHYIRSLTALCQAVEQALPAYEAAAMHDEVVFFQEVRAAILKPGSAAAPPAVVLPDHADADIPEIVPEIISGIPSEILPRAVQLKPAGRSGSHGGGLDLYDALDADDPEVEELGAQVLHQIDDELTAAIRRHVTADWTVRRGAKGEMRLMAKKILKKHKYPPSRHEVVVQAVLQQAETFCAELGGDS